MESAVSKGTKSPRKSLVNLDSPNAHKNSTTTDDFYLTESRKLIRQGNYKKAFRLIDQYYSDARKLSTVIKIKMCRRLLASLSAICSRKLVKDIQKPENFLKFLESGNSYLEQWHQNILHFAYKTNQKLDSAHSVLEDLSVSSSEEITTMRHSRLASKTILKNEGLTSNKRDTQRKSILLQILKTDSRDRQLDQIYNSSLGNIEEANSASEELSRDDIDISFQLDEYLCYFLIHMMHWGLYHKKQKNWNTSYRFFMLCLECSKKLESSENPLVLYTCARVRIPLAVMYMEYDKYTDAQEIFESSLCILQKQLTIKYTKIEGKEGKNYSTLGINRSVKLMVILLLLSGKTYELQDHYLKHLESYKLANWFCSKFLQTEEKEDELVKTVNEFYAESKEEFGSHLEEIGEMERIAFGGQLNRKRKRTYHSVQGDGANNFQKLQETLYKKFNHSDLNRMRIPVQTSSKTLGIKVVTDEVPDISSNVSHVRTLRNSRTDLKTPLETEIAEHKNISLKSLAQTLLRTKKAEIKKFTFGGKTWNQVSSEKWKLLDKNEYSDEVKIETRIANTQLNEHEQRKYLNMLNRNIRSKRPLSVSSTGRFNTSSQEYVDIDSFFQNHVSSSILKDQDEKSRPEGFDRIVKGYAHFLKSEDFDQKGFKFSDHMINLKQRENLGENPDVGKYHGPNSLSTKHFHGPQFAKEKRDVETVSYFIQTQTQVENTIQSRINLSKGKRAKSVAHEHSHGSNFFKGPPNLAGSEFSASTLIASPPKIRQSESIDEEFKTDEKAKLSDILLKHRKELNLQAVASVLKKNSRHSSHRRQGSSTQATDAGVESLNTPEINERKWKNIGLMRLTGMMENIQNEIKCDEIIKTRLKMNQPIVQEEKPRERVLKNFDDLASSTGLLLVKRNASQKNLDFSEVVAIQTKIKSEEKKRESLLLRRKGVSPNKTVFNPTQDSTNFSISVSKYD